jgi:3'-phosphoadenosine 5'-phosphosulfate sulfotransferase (PAPS reductase)/FAD synthetase
LRKYQLKLKWKKRLPLEEWTKREIARKRIDEFLKSQKIQINRKETKGKKKKGCVPGT